MRDPFVGQLALMRLVGLHYCPFRLCGGLIGESRSTVGIHQMQRRRKAVLSVLDYRFMPLTVRLGSQKTMRIITIASTTTVLNDS